MSGTRYSIPTFGELDNDLPGYDSDLFVPIDYAAVEALLNPENKRALAPALQASAQSRQGEIAKHQNEMKNYLNERAHRASIAAENRQKIADENKKAAEKIEKTLEFLIAVADHDFDNTFKKVWKKLLAALLDDQYSDFLIETLDSSPKVKKTLLGLLQKQHEKLLNATNHYIRDLEKQGESSAHVEPLQTKLSSLPDIKWRTLRNYRDNIKEALKCADNSEMKKQLNKPAKAATVFSFIFDAARSIFTHGISRTFSAISHAKKMHHSVLFFTPSAKSELAYQINKEKTRTVKKQRQQITV